MLLYRMILPHNAGAEMIRNFRPQSIYERQRAITRAQPSSTSVKNPFGAGAFPDLDETLVPENGVHSIENYVNFPGELKTRSGCQLWSSTPLPAKEGYTGFSWTKTGNVLTRTAGPIFTTALTGTWAVHDSGKNERIESYIDQNNVIVHSSDVVAASTAGYIRDNRNSRCFHKKLRIWVLLLGTKIYYSDTIRMESWTEVYKRGSFMDPADQVSQMGELDDYVILRNSNGWFKIDMTQFVYWQMNSAVPSERISDDLKTAERKYCRKVTYSCSYLSGKSEQDDDRFTAGVVKAQETGTTAPDSSGSDSGEIWTTRPVGDGTTYYQRIVGAALSGGYEDISGWSAITTVQFGFTADGVSYNIVADITGVLSLEQIAERIQIAMQSYWPDILFTFSAGSFICTNPVEGGTVGYSYAGGGATDIGTSIMGMDGGSGSISSVAYTAPLGITNLTMPINPDTGNYDTHLNTYTLYAGLDAGEEGVNPVTGEANNPERRVWIADVPAAKAMRIIKTGSLLVITDGVSKFSAGDKESVIKLQNGVFCPISSVLTDTTAYTYNPYSVYPEQAGAIGGDTTPEKSIRVMSIQQSGQAVTRQSGDSFQANDVGKPLYLQGGAERHIIEYIDSDHVNVLEEATITSDAAACIEPKTRNWSDVVRDTPYGDAPNISSRMKVDYILSTRLHTPLPNCNIGEITSLFLFGAVAGEKKIYYCDISGTVRHCAGYHYEPEQRIILKDVVNEISEIADTLSIKCESSTRGIVLTSVNTIINETLGTSIAKVLADVSVDDEVGVKHFSAVRKINKNTQFVITSEPAIKLFNGHSYSDNYAFQRIQKVLNQMENQYSIEFTPSRGVTFWGLYNGNSTG